MESRRNIGIGSAAGRVRGFLRFLGRSTILMTLVCVLLITALSQSEFEKHKIAKVDISLADAVADAPTVEQYRMIAGEALGPIYSTPRVRDAIASLYDTRKIDTITVNAALNPAGDVELTFNIKRKTQVGKVEIEVAPIVGDNITEQELLFKLNLLTAGTTLTEQVLQNNADQILDYLRERGFFQSQVTYARRALPNQNDIGVTFKVMPGVQALVENFSVNIEGYAKPFPLGTFKLEKGKPYSRDRLLADVVKVRNILKKDDFLAPEIDEPRPKYDGDTNTISISILGRSGPTAKVSVDSPVGKVPSSSQNTLLPVKRDGTLDFSAIVEGERRLENYYQEQGYFFADVTPFCSVTPQITDIENVPIANETQFLCQFLGGEDLMGRAVAIKYVVKPDRKLTLRRLRLQGTDKLTIEDIRPVLASQEASLLGVVPYLAYGRGYTSASILEEDAATIKSLMAELGYREADVRVTQGVTPTGDELIITFVIEEGPAYVVKDVDITGNKAVETRDLLAQLPALTGLNYSRARERNAVRKLREYYSNLGYYDARVTSKMTELPPVPGVERRDVRIDFKVESENKKVVIDRLLVNGNEHTKEKAIRKALALKPGEFLKSADIYTSEQNLYGSDAFSRVDIKPQPAGDGANGTRKTDVIVNVEEQPTRIMSYGGGFSTDVGLSGFFDIRHTNLFRNLWQGGARIKVSQRQQLVQFDFVNPRFLRDGPKRWAPLTLSAWYQRDTTVTRFFRSSFDKGTFGIVQRVDADGNPIDEFGRKVSGPTINRLAVSAETSRTISRRDRSILFFRYRFEDVRLFNIDSLLIKDLLRPDRKTTISGFSATFVRDTRRNCSVKTSLLELIAKGEPADKCRYNASDPTNGDYLTADYSVSLPALGANVGFQKFQASYNFYYSFGRLKNTTLAARGILGVASVFSGGNRYTGSSFPSLNGLLPISERFFAGGPNNLRGFDFEEAGPRVVIVPQGSFRNSKGDPVFLDPFTIPFGGNALAVVNIEGRVPLSKSIRVVPFYDGGNVFRRAGEIFKRPAVNPNDVAAVNQRAVWTHTVGLGLRIKTPIGGEFGVDYGRLLNAPVFLIPQTVGPAARYQLRQGQIHFRFSQAF